MPLVRARQLRELSMEELRSRIARLRQERYELLQKKEAGQLDRPHRFAHIRRETAQTLAVLAEKEKKNP